MGRNYSHVVDVPFWDYMIRIVQAILAMALVILTAYTLAFNDFASVRLSLFTVSPEDSQRSKRWLIFMLLGSLGCRHLGLLPHRCPCPPLYLQLGRRHHHRVPHRRVLGGYLFLARRPLH